MRSRGVEQTIRRVGPGSKPGCFAASSGRAGAMQPWRLGRLALEEGGDDPAWAVYLAHGVFAGA